MGLLRFIDRKITFQTQKRYLISFLFFGIPFGYLCGLFVAFTLLYLKFLVSENHRIKTMKEVLNILKSEV